MSNDHVPSKVLLERPLPPNLPVVEICRQCNTGFSRDEEYTAGFIATVLAGSAEGLTLRPGLRNRIARSRKLADRAGDSRPSWVPELARVHRVLVKNARGHAYYELGEPLLDEPANVWCAPVGTLDEKQRYDFEAVGPNALWPEVGSRMLFRAVSGHDLNDGWVVVQSGIYRYAVEWDGPIRVKSVIREYLATEVGWG